MLFMKQNTSCNFIKYIIAFIILFISVMPINAVNSNSIESIEQSGQVVKGKILDAITQETIMVLVFRLKGQLMVLSVM